MRKLGMAACFLLSMSVLTAAPNQGNRATSGQWMWQTAEPAMLGLNEGAVEDHQRLCEQTGADSCLVVYKDKIVTEWYSSKFREPVYAMSSTKSITSLVVGKLVDEGKISLDDPVHKYIPEWNSGSKRNVTLRHLLNHTSGLSRKTGAASVGNVSDKNAHVINLPLDKEPGVTFSYSNEAVQLLSPILDKAAGEPVQDYARKHLFEPLGMTKTRFKVDAMNHAWTYADMLTTPRDLARIGVLMTHGGKWQGKRIISEDYIRQATSASQPLSNSCGLLWWLFDQRDSLKGYAALGYLETDLFVFPEDRLIVVRTQSPKAGFSGKPEGSEGYRKRALVLFKKMVNK